MGISVKGVLNDARPNQPQEPAYDTPNIGLRGLNHGGKYSDDVLANGRLPLALHHVIPWNLLRDFWNKIQSCEYWECLAVYGSMVGVTQSTMSQMTRKMRRSQFGNAIDLDASICWAEWNLVRGPQHRSDDPGEELDNMRSSYGRSADNSRIKSLLGFGAQMSRHLAGTPREADVRELIDQMKRKLNRKKIMEFNSAIWRTQSDSPQFVPATRDAFATQPLWHIRGQLTD